jgi:hypothetical protein
MRGDGTRDRTRVFTALLSHHQFADRFGRPGKGNDNGKVRIDRDRGMPRGTAPPTPPGIRIRTAEAKTSQGGGTSEPPLRPWLFKESGPMHGRVCGPTTADHNCRFAQPVSSFCALESPDVGSRPASAPVRDVFSDQHSHRRYQASRGTSSCGRVASLRGSAAMPPRRLPAIAPVSQAGLVPHRATRARPWNRS